MAADVLSRLSTCQTGDSNIDDDISAYAVADFLTVPDDNAEERVQELTMKIFVVVQKEDASCRHLAQNSGASDSQYFIEKFGIFSKLARLDGAMLNVVSLSPRAKMPDNEKILTTPGNLRAKHMCDKMGRSCCCPHLTNDVMHYKEHCKT